MSEIKLRKRPGVELHDHLNRRNQKLDAHFQADASTVPESAKDALKRARIAGSI
jgi:hypothetical protein